jgi:hypothetical protein
MPWAPVRHATPLAVCLRRFAVAAAPLALAGAAPTIS